MMPVTIINRIFGGYIDTAYAVKKLNNMIELIRITVRVVSLSAAKYMFLPVDLNGF